MLISCPECRRKLSDSARTCPGCGCDLEIKQKERERKQGIRNEIKKTKKKHREDFNNIELKREQITMEEYKQQWGYTPYWKFYHEDKIKKNPKKYLGFDFTKNYKTQLDKFNKEKKMEAKKQGEEKAFKLARQQEWYRNNVIIIILFFFFAPAAVYGLYRRWSDGL